MMSLFSSFDFFIFYFSFFSLIFLFLIFFGKFFFFSTLDFLVLVSEKLGSFFYSLKPSMFNKFSLLMILVLFFLILSVNIFSIFPYVFPFSSQFGPVLLVSLSIWLSFMMFNFLKNLNGFFSHFIPEGTPLPLTFILFMIELISNIIRPITLTVRLVANILAGHLLMILLSKMVFFYNIFFPLYTFLNMVELFVALIQSYIFCTMLILYFSEVH